MIATIITLFLASAGVYALYPHLIAGYQRYPEFIAGLIGFDDYNKTGEGRLFQVGLLLFFVLYPLIARFSPRTKDSRSSFQTGILLIIGLLFGRSFMRGNFLTASFFALCAAPLFRVRDQKLQDAISLGAVSAGITFISSIGALTGLAYFSLYPDSIVTTVAILVPILCATSGALGAVCEYTRPGFGKRILLALQIPASCIALKCLTLCVMGPQGVVPFQHSQFSTIFFSGATILGVGYALYKTFVGDSRQIPILWPTLMAAGVIFGFGFPAPSTLSVDMFHLGEMILPWHQIAEHGLTPYTEFVPVQGLIGILIGWINNVFYDGSIASFTAAGALISMFACVLTVFVTSWTLGPLAALFLAPVSLAFLDRFYLTAATFLILAHPFLLTRTRLWFASAVIICSIGLFWNAPSTIALVIAAFPIALTLLYRELSATTHTKTKRALSLLGPAVILTTIAFLILPLKGVLTFVYENGYINTVQHSTKFIENWMLNPWFPQYFTDPKWNRITWELIRTGGWVIGSCILFSMQHSLLAKRREPLAIGAFLLCIGGIIFSVILFPYSMGRVDPPVHMSRVGTVSMAVLTFFIPATFLYAQRYLQCGPFPALAIGFIVGLPLGIKGYTIPTLLDLSRAQSGAPANYVVVEGKDVGIPKFGTGYIPQETLDSFHSFKNALGKVLHTGETFEDLTNHTANYALLDLPFPYLYPSANAIGSRIQKRIIKQFEAHPPAAVAVAPFFEIDRASHPLRNFYIYKWLFTNGYKLVTVDGYGFMLSPERFLELKLPEASAEMLRKTFITTDLSGLPKAWGKSFDTLRPLVHEAELPVQIADLTDVQRGKEGWLTLQKVGGSFNLKLPEPVKGLKYDYLLIRFERLSKGAKKPLIGLSLVQQGKTYPTSDFTFWSGPETLIVPISANPAWYTGTTEAFRIAFERENPGISWRVKSMKLLTLKD